MIYFQQGTSIVNIQSYSETLHGNVRKLAWLMDYYCQVSIICNLLTTFLEQNSITLLLHNDFMPGILKAEGIIICDCTDVQILSEQLSIFLEKLTCLKKNINLMMEKYKGFIEYNYEPCGDDFDDRLVFDITFEKANKIFEIAQKKGYVEKITDEMLNANIRCTDSNTPFPGKLHTDYMFHWLGSDNEMVYFLDYLFNKKYLCGDAKKRYNQASKCFITKRGTRFIDLAKKSNNIKNSLTDYSHIENIINEAEEFFHQKDLRNRKV